MRKTKPIFLVLLVFFLLIALTSPIFASADKVAYIVYNPSIYDLNLVNALQDKGFTIDIVDNDNVGTLNWTSYRFMLVDDHLFGNDQDIPVNDFPAVIVNTWHMTDWHWASSIGVISATQPLQVKVIDTTHYITKNLPGYIQVYTTGSKPMYYLSKYGRSYNLDAITSITGGGIYDSDLTIATAEPGTLLKNGIVSNVRSCWYGIIESEYWTYDAKALFQNCADWVAYGGDADQDEVRDDFDNCIGTYNPYQEDLDADNVGNVCDNCINTSNSDQQDTDQDGIGNVCDTCPNDPLNDADQDGVCGDVDLCEGYDDNLDADSDGIPDGCDSCPLDPLNDIDQDDICGNIDNCPNNANPNQENFDQDSLGDVCDPDKDNDGYNSTQDCNDYNASIKPGAQELCNNIDDNCNQQTDEALTKACGQGVCAGTSTCSAGIWGNCSTNGQDVGVCAICNASGQAIYDETQDSDCNDSTYCNGQETCQAIYSCQQATAINCSQYNIQAVGQCNYNPDNVAYTYDYFAGFTSQCNESADACAQGVFNLTHTCSVQSCGAECDDSNHCEDTDCDHLDGCQGNHYYDYDDIANNCLADCICEQNQCSSPTIYENDPRCTECQIDDDCNNLDSNYCDGDNLMRVEGFCNASYECESAAPILAQNCNNLNNDYCLGTQIKHDDYTCNAAACVLNSTTLVFECDDFQYCNGQETCGNANCIGGAPIDCSQYNLPEIATCTNNPDNKDFTWDSASGFTSECDEDANECTQSTYEYVHTCNIQTCGAECESDLDCANKCVGEVYHYSGECNTQTTCSCSYLTEDCDQYDDWYDTGATRWIELDQCNEKEQKEQEYQDYSCGIDGCDYTTTGTQWVDTDSTRPKQDGTTCDDGLYCTINDQCTAGICGGSARDCSAYDDQCNIGMCNENSNTCEAQPAYEAEQCDDGLYCTISDKCTAGECIGLARDCSQYNLLEIATCTNNPDNKNFTWDSASDFTSECDENANECTQSTYEYVHTCNIQTCGAECESDLNCANKCVGGVYHYSGECNTQTTCSCNYLTEDCDQYDDWYNTQEKQWVSINQCNEKEQERWVYKEYSCSLSGCIFSITDTKWVETGQIRNKADGTTCDDGLYCTISDKCTAGECVSLARDCSQYNLPEIATCTNNPDNKDFTWDSASGFTSECDEDANECTQSTYEYTHTCNIQTCGANCESDGDCGNMCIYDVYYYSGECDTQTTCACEYITEDCNQYDGWYNSECNNYMWVDIDQCNEKEQVQKDYRNYFCTLDGCDYTTTQTGVWFDTGVQRPKQDSTYCNDGLYCTINDMCNQGVCGGIARDCSANNIAPVSQCDYSPDDIDYTYDYFAAFTSECDEDADECTQETFELTHTCSVANCEAQCDEQNPCDNTDCDFLDGCHNGPRYYDCDDIINTCLADCTCEENICPLTYLGCGLAGTDYDQDGWDTQCGDCDDFNPNINPVADEICDNYIDEDCDGEFNNGCVCESYESDRICIDDGFAGVTYSWNYNYCNEAYVVIEEDPSCNCEYTSWENDECIADGSMRQIKHEITQFEYCADKLYQNIGNPDCDCESYESDRICVDDGFAGVTYSWNHNYCGESYIEIEEDLSCNCEYTSWENDECIANGSIRQVRYETTQFDYCADEVYQTIQNTECNCQYSEWENEACSADGYMHQTRSESSGYVYCLEPLERNLEYESCACEYTEWENVGCVGDGLIKQQREENSGYEYCNDNLVREIENPMCGCIPTELSRECVANVTAHVTYLWNYPYCGPESENVYDIACYICQPTWECNNYAECTMEGYQQCLSVYDIHSCNETYPGDYSEFTKSCDYCSIHSPTLTIQDEITVYEGELVKLDLETDDPDEDALNYTISEPVGDDKEWQTQKGDKGTYSVDIVVTDGFCTTTKTIKIIVKEKPYQSMIVERTAYNEFVGIGEEQQLYVTLENIGNTDIKELKVGVFIDDLGIWKSTKKFTLHNGEEKTKNIEFTIPSYAKPGRYYMRIVVSNDNIRKVFYRDFDVI